MSKSLVEQSDLEPGYAYITAVGALLGKSVLKKVLIPGGKHPKMRLLTATINTGLTTTTGPTEEASFVVAIVTAGAGAEVDVVHSSGMIAGESLGMDAVGGLYPLSKPAKSTTVTDDCDVFEADEDVCYIAGAAAGADLDLGLLIAKFEVIN